MSKEDMRETAGRVLLQTGADHICHHKPTENLTWVVVLPASKGVICLILLRVSKRGSGAPATIRV